MDRPSLLVLVRHAQSEHNKARQDNVYIQNPELAARIRGIADSEVPLTELGITQARMIGLRIRELMGGGPPDVVYHSGYRRTMETMDEALLAGYAPEEIAQMKIRQSDRLRERDPGYTFGMTTQEADASFPWLADHFNTFGYFLARPPGGESQADVCDRLYSFIGEHLFKHRVGQRVVIFTHGGVIRAIRYNLEKWHHQAYLEHLEEAPANCGITTYRYSATSHRLELEKYNDVVWAEPTSLLRGV